MYVCMHACMHVCMHACMYACMYVCMHVCMDVWMYGCMYVRTDVCVYVHTYMYACMYAYQVVVMAFNEAGHVGPGLLDETALAEICQPDSVSWALCGQVSCVSCLCVCVCVCVCEYVHIIIHASMHLNQVHAVPFSSDKTHRPQNVSVGRVLCAEVHVCVCARAWYKCANVNRKRNGRAGGWGVGRG